MKKIKIIMTIFLLILLFCSNFVFAKYLDIIYGEATTVLKRAIFLVEPPQEINNQISSLNNNYYESEFNILNYIGEEISEIEYEYTIKIIPSTYNFPVKYHLINLQTNEEVVLNSNLETETLRLDLNKQKQNYKLIAQWDFENTNQNLDEILKVEILVKGVQKQ